MTQAASSTAGTVEERIAAIAEFHPLAAAAMRAINGVMEAESPVVMGWSSGKDSSVLVSLAFTVAVARRLNGLPVPKMLVVHTDTGVESPAVRQLADGELEKMQAFADAHGLPLQIRIGHPSLYTSWPLRVIGGRALPSFPTGSADCSQDWKINTSNRLMDEVFADLKKDRSAAQPVVMTGVRLDESTTRASNIRARGESASEVWTNAKGRLGLSPIIHWSAEDVFEYLGYASAEMIETYSDFSETLQFYRDAGGSSCAVVGDMRLAESSRENKGCGARSGCWACVRVQSDKSAETMIASDPERYGFMRNLNKLRNYIANTQYDWTSRNYLGRTIDADGYVAVGADVYSPTMLERLLRMTLTVQMREQAAAARLGIKPRFSIMGFRELVAIDAQWSLYGIHKPFHALKVFFEVMDGKLLDPPVTGPLPRTPVPKYGKIYVGRAWEDDRRTGDPKRDRMLSSGIRSHAHEMFSESNCGFETKFLSNGECTTAWDTEDAFEVDEDGAADFVMIMSDEYLARYHNDETDRTQAMSTYLSMGIVAPAHASIGRWHAIAQRTQWMQRHGLVGEIQRERLLEMIEEQRAGAIEAKNEAEALEAPAAGHAQGSLFSEEGLLLEAETWFEGFGPAPVEERDEESAAAPAY